MEALRTWLTELQAQAQWESKANGGESGGALEELAGILLATMESTPEAAANVQTSSARLPSLLAATEAALSTPPVLTRDLRPLDSLTQAALLQSFVDRTRLPTSLLKKAEDKEAKLELPTPECRECGCETGVLERTVVSGGGGGGAGDGGQTGGLLHHRSCFACSRSRCSRRLRPGLYASLSGPKGEAFECLLHEQEDLLARLASHTAATDPPPQLQLPQAQAAPLQTSLEMNDVIEDSNEAADDNFKSIDSVIKTDQDAGESSPSVPEQETETTPTAEPSQESTNGGLYPSLATLQLSDDKESEKPAPSPGNSGETGIKAEESASGDEKKDETAEEAEIKQAETVEKKEETSPVAPPRRKRRSAASSRAPSAEPSSFVASPRPVSTVKPPLPPKPPALRKDILDEYPDGMNPFGTDSEASDDSDEETGNYDDSLNPFASDLEETGSVSGKGSLGSGSLNPFGADSDSDSGRQSSSPLPTNHRQQSRSPSRPAPPIPATRHSLIGPLTAPTSLSGPVPTAQRRSLVEPGVLRPHRAAPSPPTNQPSPAPTKLKPPRPRTVPRKKRQAPPPPRPQKRLIQTEDLVSREEVESALAEVDKEAEALEAKARELEARLGGESCDWEASCLEQWLSLVSEKGELVRKEAELVLAWREHFLDALHADVEYHLRLLLEKPESAKADADSRMEAFLLSLLLNIIERKNAIVEHRLPPAPLPDDTPHSTPTGTLREESKAAEKHKAKKLKLRLKKIKKKLHGHEKTEKKSKEKKSEKWK